MDSVGVGAQVSAIAPELENQRHDIPNKPTAANAVVFIFGPSLDSTTQMTTAGLRSNAEQAR
jgi:hypothetical protein